MRMIFSQSGETSKFASFAFVCPSLRGFCSVQYKEGKSTGGKILKRIVNFLPVLFFFSVFTNHICLRASRPRSAVPSLSLR